MCLLLVIHLQTLSVINLFASEGFGCVSNAEMIVCLSGLLTGKVYNRYLEPHRNLGKLWQKLLYKAFKMYGLCLLVMTILQGMFFLFPSFRYDSIIYFQDIWGHTYTIFNSLWQGDGVTEKLIRMLTLKQTPHQIQILGYYSVMFALSPLFVFLLKSSYAFPTLFLLFTIYVLNLFFDMKIYEFQFEYAYSLFSWQFLFFSFVFLGIHFQESLSWIERKKNYRKGIYILFFLFLILTYVQVKKESSAYHILLSKSHLGLLRLINVYVIFFVLYSFLEKYYDRFIPFKDFFLTIGKATLFVFVIHIFILVIFDTFFDQAQRTYLTNTFQHLAFLLVIYGLTLLKNSLTDWIKRPKIT